MFETIEEVDRQVESTSTDITPEGQVKQDLWSEKGNLPSLLGNFSDITSPDTSSADNRNIIICSSTISGHGSSTTSYHETKIPNIATHQRVRRESRHNFKRSNAKVINQSITQILKQNRMVVERQLTVVKELRNWKNSVNVDLKEIKNSINCLKRVNELQRFREMRNTIQRLMKEVTELKKIKPRTCLDLDPQIEESDESPEHDSYPDFEPIIPLPDEVPINTGEEHETVLLSVRATLFRFIQEDWKERGVGYLQILKNLTTGKTRVLMRREKVHQICANHFITQDILLIQMPNDPKVYSWAAHDIAYQTITLKKFSARFKSERDAESFRVAFEKAPQPTPETFKLMPATPTWLNFRFKPNVQDKSSEASNSLAPFSNITSTPAVSRNSRFSRTSSFNFNTPQISDEESMSLGFNESDATIPRNSEEEVEKVDMKTGEEVLFCHRARLFWFANGNWKQRGAGNIKIFLSAKSGKLRVLMRHDQVQNICLDHYLTPSVEYSIKDEKSWLFSVMNYLEGKYLQFCLRFKTAEIAKEFKKTIDDALKRISTLKSKNALSEVKDQDVKSVKSEEDHEAFKLPSRNCDYVMWKESDKILPHFSKLLPKQSRHESIFYKPFANFSPSPSTPVRPPSKLDNFFGKTPESSASANSTVSSFHLPIQTPNIFSQTPTSNVFQRVKSENIFSQKPATLSGSIFGGTTANMNTNISFTMATPSLSTTKNLFASFTTTSVPQGSIFGGSTTQVKVEPWFETPSEEKFLVNDAYCAPEIFKCKSDVTFASLTAATPEKPGIGKVGNDYLPFSFLDAGASVFDTSNVRLKLEKPQEDENIEDFGESDVEMLCA